MSKRNPLTRRGYEKPRGCLVPIIGGIVCVGAFVNLILDQQDTDAFFEKATPLKLGMSQREVVAIMGAPDTTDDVEIKWGARASHNAPREYADMKVDVPQRLQGQHLTRKLTWKHDRNTWLTVYLVSDEVISTASQRPGAKQ